MAGPVLEAALNLARRIHGERHLTVAAAHQALAVVHDHQGDRAGAKSRFRESISILRELGAPARANLSLALYDLANVLKLEDSLAVADSLVSESLRLMTALYDRPNVATGTARTNLGDIRRRQGHLVEAEAELSAAVAILRDALPSGHGELAAPLSLLGLVRCERGAAYEGEVPLREALGIRQRNLPPGHWLTHNLESALSVCLTRQGRYVESESLGVRGYDGLRERLGEDHPRTREAAARLVLLYERWGKPDRARLYRR
jgi:serine/threonine-protein kinase